MARSPVVISSITALYLVNVVQAVSEWVWFDTFFLLPGQSNYAAYLHANAGPHWIYLISNINAFLLATIADSLLVRSSFHRVCFSDYIARYGGAITYGIAHSA